MNYQFNPIRRPTAPFNLNKKLFKHIGIVVIRNKSMHTQNNNCTHLSDINRRKSETK